VTRKSSIFFAVILAEAAFLVLLLLHASAARKAAMPDLARNAALVRDLGLTDLCLFTEARYTSGSLLSPPEHLRTAP
jgi:hypothetical protein